MNLQTVAELRGVSKRFGNVVALDRVGLTVRSGELFAILGPNGAGKTTVISLLLGLQSPDSGAAQLFGEPPEKAAVRRGIGVMMQEVTLAGELRVREHLELAASWYPNALSAQTAMEITHTTALAGRPYGKLSGGQKRQVQFALAICGRPRLLFLDEPTVGLDVRAREALWNTLRLLIDAGCAVVLTTHYLEEAEALADRVAVLAKGRVVASGPVSEVRALVVRTRIRCTTSLDAQDVAEWAGVGSVSKDGQRLDIAATNPEAVVRRLLETDRDLEDLEVIRAGLADAFSELTQEVMGS